MVVGFSVNGDFTSPDGGLTPAFLFRDGMPPGARGELGPGYATPPPGGSPRIAPDFLLQNHVNSYAHQYNLTIQKELRGGMLFEAAYLGNLGHKIGGPPLSQNMIPLVNGRGPAAQNQRLRPFPQYTDVTLLNPPLGNSSYHAMNLKLEKRYANGLNFLMNYTWSKFLDDVQANNELGGVTNNGYTHIELRKLDKSYSGNDLRHRYVGSAVYDLPWGPKRGRPMASPVLDAIAGDWGFGVVAEFRTGSPYGVVEQTNLTNTFSAGQRPNLLRDPAIDTSHSRGDMIASYFDVSAFQAPGVGVFGSAARDVGFGPGFMGLDASVHKRWPIKERFNLQFRGDFFNVPNRPNFANPNTSRGRADFGRISSILVGSTGRRIQLGLRLEF
jgi:hypothetical protein